VATAACLIFVLLFAFAEHLVGGNFNYVCPYAHEMTHGTMLSLLSVVAAWPAERHRLFWATMSGLVLGLSFLTKTEVFLPGLIAAPMAILLGLWSERPGWRRSLARWGCFFGAFLLPPAVSFFCLALAMPGQQALLGTLGSWGAVLRRDITGSPFHLRGTGFDHPFQNALAMFRMACFYALILVPAALLGLWLRRPLRHRSAIAAATFTLVASLLWYARLAIDWGEIARPLPLLVVLSIAVVAAGFRREHREGADRRRLVQQMTLLVFALALLGKMILYTRLWQYGFVLAMPATLLLSVAAFDWVPAWIDRRGGHGEVFAAAAAALISVVALIHLDKQAELLSTKTRQVGSGADAFWADERGTAVNAALVEVARRSSPGTTLAVIPEGALLNCLSGLRNPTPYTNLLPVETMLFGQDHILASFQKRPPDLILMARQSLLDYGYSDSGESYLRPLYTWINANYRPIWHDGAPMFWLLENKARPGKGKGETDRR
jgi:hypothetical protein